ncbi:hypothetical protein A7X93_12150 [Stenotrophomonas maltophilia]|uniref:hypothetical protein n=1 Tax=Stenotrophomonas maltophilia TaxID=40324 RepID=UPI000DB5AE0A|nr:hypothetical protein A7X93_12150 [Stenotrophomonas maltophilia]
MNTAATWSNLAQEAGYERIEQFERLCLRLGGFHHAFDELDLGHADFSGCLGIQVSNGSHRNRIRSRLWDVLA